MRISLSAVTPVLALFLTVNACGDGHDHGHEHSSSHRKRLFPSSQLTKPSRPLEWGDLNIIHTTDTHGFLLGHQHTSFPEPNYSGDLGDFSSFVQHMKQLALEKDVDLLLVDSGDLHDGTGLSDGFPAGGIDAHDSNQFLKQLPYDIMAIGNHELYDYINTWDMHTNFAPALNGSYLSSNVNITVFDEHNNTVDVPVGSRYRKFTTLKGRKITSLGVLFDFTGNDKNTTVQSVADMVKEQWFAEAIAEEPDVFLLVGHMPVSFDNWPTVFNAVRAVHPETPIIILGGHTHIRDCTQLDGRSMSLESGRYMETIGWLSAKLGTPSDKNISFSRRYLDQNRVTYEYHTQQSNNSFDTLAGQNITQGLLELSDKYDLSMLFGTAPQDYTISRAPYPSNDSSLTLFIAEAAPYALTLNNSRANITNIMITNSGSQRFDVYSGPFTKNDQQTASPFLDSFVYLKNVELGVAQQVLPALNAAGADERRKRDLGLAASLEEREQALYRRGYVDRRYMEWLDEMDRRHDGAVKRASKNLTLGYVTSDSCPGVGDDTLHAPLASFDIPDFIGSNTPEVANDTLIDLVFVDFIQTQLLGILNEVQNETTYTDADVASYTDVLSNAVLGLYAEHAWN